MEKCIVDFLSALSCIDKNYVAVTGYNIENNEYQQAAEGAFTAELYHQLKSIIRHDKTGYYSGLSLHYDLTKGRFDNRRPDLVLHTSPTSRKDQRLYVEVKTSTSISNYDDDLNKLFLAVARDNNSQQLGYSNAIFLTLRASHANVLKHICEYILSNKLTKDRRLTQIYSIHLNKNNTSSIKNFSELL